MKNSAPYYVLKLNVPPIIRDDDRSPIGCIDVDTVQVTQFDLHGNYFVARFPLAALSHFGILCLSIQKDFSYAIEEIKGGS